MNNTKVNYQNIYNYLDTYKRNVITASQIAYGIGVDRIYGATMTKLVREGRLEAAPAKGYYYVVKE